MLKKITVTLAFIIILTGISSFTYAPPAGYNQHILRTIVIDAGHGGTDAGAKGAYSYEKDVTLAIALKLQERMQKAFPDIRFVMTRTTDVFDNPRVKADKANNANGDLFICIHCNAAPAQKHSEITGYKTVVYYTGKGKKRKKHTKQVPQYRYWTTPNPAMGTETYIWGPDKNDDKEVAMRENESLYIDSSLAKEIGDFDPNSPEKRILYSLKTQQYFTRSANLALMVEEEFSKQGRISREARQRQVGIWVLQATAMPSILVETGYITNPTEEDYINSEKGQYEICEAIINAVNRYKSALETNTFRNLTPQTDDSSSIQ